MNVIAKYDTDKQAYVVTKILQCTVCGEIIEEDYSAGDANGDGVIDMFDYLIVKTAYFTGQ